MSANGKLGCVVGVVLLVTCGHLAAWAGETQRVSGAYTHGNLTVFLIHGEDRLAGERFLTLQEALQQGLVVVHETGSVRQLAIENASPEVHIYIQSGEIVKGGRQDRVLALDMVLPPKSGKVPIASFCVESGRWTRRGGERADRFSASENALVTKGQRLAVKHKADQGEVWAEVAKAQTKLSENLAEEVRSRQSASSLELTLENNNLQAAADGYYKALAGVLEGKPDVVGFAFAINGKLNTAEVYGSRPLFAKLWPKLLRAAAVEAVAELGEGKPFEQPAPEAVKAWFAEAEEAKATSKDISPRLRLVTQETADDVLFETRDKAAEGRWIHRSYMKK